MKLPRQLADNLKSQLAALIREREDLRERLAMCERQIAAIRILADGEPALAGNHSGPGLAPSVRAALQHLGRTSSPQDVCDELKRLGFKWTGAGKLISAVSTELYRQAHTKSSPIERIRRGKYRIKKEL
jgi:hypothetical protein